MLFFLEPARFVTKLKDISIPMKQKLQLVCTFKGAPKMFVTWYKNGKQLYASYRYNTKVTGNSCIVECLHECDKDTPGTYACEVSNAYGTEICYADVSVITGQYTVLHCWNGFLWIFGSISIKNRTQWSLLWKMHGCMELIFSDSDYKTISCMCYWTMSKANTHFTFTLKVSINVTHWKNSLEAWRTIFKKHA